MNPTSWSNQMSMQLDLHVNGRAIAHIEITNLTHKMSGINTYRWKYTNQGDDTADMPRQVQDTIEHTMEDGAIVLVSKVTQAASEALATSV